MVRVLRYLIYVFVVLWFALAVLGKVHAKKVKADNVKAFCVRHYVLRAPRRVRGEPGAARVDGGLAVLRIGGLHRGAVNAQSAAALPSAEWTMDTDMQEGVRGWFVGMSTLLQKR